MSHLVALKQKIRSVQTTKKITHAVRLISMSLYNKLDKMRIPLEHYTHTIQNIFIQLASQAPQWHNPIFSPNSSFDENPLFIIIATTKGLCGSLNSNLFRYVDASLLFDSSQQPHFIAVGQKAITYIKERGHANLICTYTDLSSNNFITIANDLVEKITQTDKPYSSVTLFGSQTISFFCQKPLKTILIPFGAQKTDSLSNQSTEISEYIWEQDQTEILDTLALRYVRSNIIHSLFQSLCAEQAARFMAMEHSTTNAEKYLERLLLQFNKLRQSLITREILELTSGSQHQQ